MGSDIIVITCIEDSKVAKSLVKKLSDKESYLIVKLKSMSGK